MKKIITVMFLIVLATQILKSQVPEKFNYQGVLRGEANELITNTDIGLQVSLYEGSSSETAVYVETHSTQTNNYGQFNVQVGTGTTTDDFSAIDWSSGQVYLKVSVDEDGESNYTDLPTVQLLTVPYALYSNSAANLGDKNIYSAGTDTLFVVKDYDGNVVFAVYPDGVMVYVNETAKGKIGGFAVSGRNPAKETEENYMVVTADSTRVYVNQPLKKGKIGGFAVSGRNPAKAIEEDYLVVTADSTRIYVNQETGKGKIGGFAVSGRNPAKATVNNFLDITPDNYFIGHESGKNTETYIGNDIGKYNVFLGYQAGMENLTGLKNVFIGYKAAQANTHGQTNVYIGSESGYNNTDGYDNVFLGSSSGYNNTEGFNNVFLGSRSGFSNLDGDDNVFVGFESGYNNTTGLMNTFIGKGAGRANISGSDNIFIGEQSGFSNIDGSENIFIGKRAGQFIESAVKNTFIGSYSGQQVSIGTDNTFLGHKTGLAVKEGSQNTYIGALAVNRDSSGVNNVALGFNAGGWSYGSNNVYIGVAAGMNYEGDSSIFIGHNAGFNATGSHKLYIQNENSPTPLIYGEFDNDKVAINGSLDVTDSLTVNGPLAVNGSINYGVTTGTDTYVATIPGIKQYTEGMALYIKFGTANTSAVTIDINGLGAKEVRTAGLSPLSGGELNGGSIYMLIFDGTNFQLITM